MTERHLSAVPDEPARSEAELDLEPEPECRWPECPEDGAVSPDGGTTWWCWDHLTDDALPTLESGVLGSCVRCRTSCVTWWVRWPEAEDLCLHEHCRRSHLMALAEGGAEAARRRQSDVRGAYARRGQGS